MPAASRATALRPGCTNPIAVRCCRQSSWFSRGDVGWTNMVQPTNRPRRHAAWTSRSRCLFVRVCAQASLYLARGSDWSLAEHTFVYERGLSAAIRSQDKNGCATLRKWSAFLAIGSLRLWRCDAASFGTRTSAWRSGSRCASRTHNAPTGKRTARLRKPHAVCLSSTLSYQPADEHAGGAMLEQAGKATAFMSYV